MDKRQKVNKMANAFTQKVMEDMFKNILQNTESEEGHKMIDGIIDMTSIMAGPEGWDKADPVTVAVKIPESVLKLAFIMRDEAGVNTAEFLEYYIERLVLNGITAITENLHKHAHTILREIVKK